MTDTEPELTAAEQAYNEAAYELWQLGAYGHFKHWPESAGHPAAYIGLLQDAQKRFEDAVLLRAAERSNPLPPEICSRCRLPVWTHELWACLPWHMGDFVGDDEMRREVVLRELNQGALAGMQSRVSEQAVDLVLAVLNRYDTWAGEHTAAPARTGD